MLDDKIVQPSVGIFWMVGDCLVAAGCSLREASPYGDCLTYDGGHAEHWDEWQVAGGAWLRRHHLPLTILSTEYDDHPRGRIVHASGTFIIYADRRLQARDALASIRTRFGLLDQSTEVQSDDHYR